MTQNHKNSSSTSNIRCITQIPCTGEYC